MPNIVHTFRPISYQRVVALYLLCITNGRAILENWTCVELSSVDDVFMELLFD